MNTIFRFRPIHLLLAALVLQTANAQGIQPTPDSLASDNSVPSAHSANPEIAHETVLDFRRGNRANGVKSGVVELFAPHFHGEAKMQRESDRLIITLPKHTLPPQQQKHLDVSEFATPVRQIIMQPYGKDTRVIVRTTGLWDVQMHNQAGRLRFEVFAQQPQAAADGISTKNKTFSGKKISLDFQSIDVRVILQILAKESGLNIVASDSVSGKMTLTLKDVPWDQALDLVLQARNLDMRRSGNIINVAPRDELLAKDKANLQTQNEINQLGALFSQTFQLKYRSVEELRKVLQIEQNAANSSRGGVLSNRGSVVADPQTNTLIVTDNQSVLAKVQKLVEQLDTAARQVMIEARIVEASEGVSRDLGVRFGFSGVTNNNAWGSNLTTAQANRTAHNAYTSGTVNNINYTLNPNINLPVAAATSSIALIHSISSGALGLELAAQQAENRAKIISSPRVLTQDRKEAVIESGTEIPYEEATSSGATSVSFKKAVLGLTVKPNITPDGQIIMEIKVNKDSIDSSCNASEPCINTQRLHTNAMVEDGGTLVLGGIYEENSSNSVQKVPLLGDIPLLGNLFKYRAKSEGKKELLIFITPRIVSHTGANQSQFLPY
ncbi:MAG: type IV pilus secretin PilQ family protein [Neisseria sp.]|nr:type IV pilus secretin PilQ family protein [Neisseria sp.]